MLSGDPTLGFMQCLDLATGISPGGLNMKRVGMQMT